MEAYFALAAGIMVGVMVGWFMTSVHYSSVEEEAKAKKEKEATKEEAKKKEEEATKKKKDANQAYYDIRRSPDWIELNTLISAYREADGISPVKFKTVRPVGHGLLRDELRERIPRVLDLNRRILIANLALDKAFIDPGDFVAAARITATIVGEWIDEVYTAPATRRNVADALGLYVLGPHATQADFAMPPVVQG